MLEFTQFLADYTIEIAVTLGVLVLLGAIAALWMRYLRNTADKRRNLKIIRDLGTQYLHDVLVPDGVDGFVAIDFLILTPGGIVVIDMQNYNGLLFGGERTENWTQMLGFRGYKFTNPLPANRLRIQAIKMAVPGVPVAGRVVFSSNGRFPKGIPDGVSMLGTLKDDMMPLMKNGEVPSTLQKAWEVLLSKVREPIRA
ncbi:MAG: NERD domain-containing protein [Gammaproteobacteria bacterium]|nr:NERD domain-containing protein [Gammaproteobacteria bacterium]